MHILVNLPDGFGRHASLTGVFERLGQLGEVHRTSHNRPEEIRADLTWADAVLMWSWPVWSEDLLDAAPHLKYSGQLDITQAGARVALARGLPVSVSRHGWSPAVSEMALALILSTLRRVSDYHSQMRQGTEAWVRDFPADVDPLERELTDRSVGLVGFGHVGRRLARLLEPFRCPLRIYDPYVSEDVVTAHQALHVDLADVIRESDVVVLCAASNPGTRHLIGPAEIALFRPHAVFVNVARAALVDTGALVERLQQDDMFAALNVFDREPLEKDSILRTLPNVYLTPHRAGGTIASVLRTLHWLIDDLEACLADKPRHYALTEQMLPNLDA